jgi:hypothetical protein
MTGRPDLNDIGVLRRREIEARIVAPLIEAFVAEFGRERVLAVAKQVIVDAEMYRAHHHGRNALLRLPLPTPAPGRDPDARRALAR